MLDYDPVTKLYLVKRMSLVADLQECERETLSRQSQRSRLEDESLSKPRSESPAKKSASDVSPQTTKGSTDRSKIPHVPRPGAKSSLPSLNVVKMKEGGLESEGGNYHWVPRVRVMFAAEDPRVFANRVAHAHMSR